MPVRSLTVESVQITPAASLAIGIGRDGYLGRVIFALPKQRALQLQAELEVSGSADVEVEEEMILT